jgi:hypothetical protein
MNCSTNIGAPGVPDPATRLPDWRDARRSIASSPAIKTQSRVSLHELPIASQFPKLFSGIKPFLMLRYHQAGLAQYC